MPLMSSFHTRAFLSFDGECLDKRVCQGPFLRLCNINSS